MNSCETAKAAEDRIAKRRPQFRSRACRENQGQRSKHRRKRCHEDRPETLHASLVNGVLARKPAHALRFQREIDEHDAILLHDADQEDDANQRDDGELLTRYHEREQRAEPGRGQRREDRERVYQVLIEDTQHEIDGDKSREDEKRRRGLLLLKGKRLAGKLHVNRTGYMEILPDLQDLRQNLADADILSGVEADGHGRELARVVDRKRYAGKTFRRNGRKRHLLTAVAVYENTVEPLQVSLHVKVGFEDDVVLIAEIVNRRDRALRERIVQSVVDVLHSDAVLSRLEPVDRERNLRAARLAVRVDVHNARVCA